MLDLLLDWALSSHFMFGKVRGDEVPHSENEQLGVFFHDLFVQRMRQNDELPGFRRSGVQFIRVFG